MNAMRGFNAIWATAGGEDEDEETKAAPAESGNCRR